MTLEVGKYNLPDINILGKSDVKSYSLNTWIPDTTYIILGQSNSIEKSVITEKIVKDEVRILKRPSGGESVVLTPNTIVISSVIKTSSFKNPKEYFEKINEKIIQVLRKLGIQDLHHKGISDIAIGEKKILGSSIYRRKDTVFYHAVLNVSETTDFMEKYLTHPNKEPDYRKGREHKDFVTSLSEQGYELKVSEISSSLRLAN